LDLVLDVTDEVLVIFAGGARPPSSSHNDRLSLRLARLDAICFVHSECMYSRHLRKELFFQN
jgi:hypothetical protein